MIVIAADSHRQSQADDILRDLSSAFPGRDISCLLPGSPPLTDQDNWDDLLILLFDSDTLPTELERFASDWIVAHRLAAAVLPVAMCPELRQPPVPLSDIKALEYCEAARGPTGRLALRVGAILGMKPDRRGRKLFISYRVTDGSTTATALHEYLNAHGFRAWMDEAPEGTNLEEGVEVQGQIEGRIKDETDLIVLIDTPDAPQSKWIRDEINLANGYLVPIFPVCCRPIADQLRGPRFAALRALSRYETIDGWSSALSPSESDMEPVLKQLEQLVCEIFQRRSKLPYIARRAFEGRRFLWEEHNRRMTLYGASRRLKPAYVQRFLIHCALLEGCYGPALEAFARLGASHLAERSYYLYDGVPVPDEDLAYILDHAAFKDGRSPFALHINELSAHLATMGEV